MEIPSMEYANWGFHSTIHTLHRADNTFKRPINRATEGDEPDDHARRLLRGFNPRIAQPGHCRKATPKKACTFSRITYAAQRVLTLAHHPIHPVSNLATRPLRHLRLKHTFTPTHYRPRWHVLLTFKSQTMHSHSEVCMTCSQQQSFQESSGALPRSLGEVHPLSHTEPTFEKQDIKYVFPRRRACCRGATHYAILQVALAIPLMSLIPLRWRPLKILLALEIIIIPQVGGKFSP